MLLNNGKKAGYSQVYDDPEALIDAASNGKLFKNALQYRSKLFIRLLVNG